MNNKQQDNDRLEQVLQLLLDASNEKKMDLKSYIHEIYENIKKTEDQACERLKSTASHVDKHAHEKPWIYISAAALGGLILGLLCRRR